MKTNRPLPLTVALFAGLTLGLTGCPEKRPGTTAVFANRPARPTSRPAGGSGAPFAPFANGGGATTPSEKGVERALPMTGHNSVTQMKVELAGLPEADRAAYEQAYRLTFASNKDQRSPGQARQLFSQLIDKHPKFGPAYRGVAYTYVDDGFQVQQAIAWYEKGVAADPDYGLAHYGLAFMLGAFNETQRGYEHFQQAMKLGVEDERNLKSKFYASMGEGIRTH